MRPRDSDAKASAERHFRTPSADERSAAWREHLAAQAAARERMQRQREARLAKGFTGTNKHGKTF
jgi:hypothetical protein